MNGVSDVSNINLHPTVREFKAFINQHPKLIKEIRKNGRSWQEYYEKWVLLGEDDPLWESFKEPKEAVETNKKTSSGKPEWINQIIKMTENMDINKVQEQVNQLSDTVSTLQEVLGQFQHKDQQEDTEQLNNHQERPFKWFKD